ncbi:flagellar biosynthetic protein FliQ [Vibrio sp.]|nr:flagellar biosynthetic protein FliQ [Vibrio sp.]
MTPEIAVDLISNAVWVIVKFTAVLITPSLVIGLVIAVFQGATQINEQTMSFLPRLMALLIMVVVAGHWMLGQMTTFFHYLFFNMPILIG